MPRFSIPAAASFCLVGFDQSGRARKKNATRGGQAKIGWILAQPPLLTGLPCNGSRLVFLLAEI